MVCATIVGTGDHSHGLAHLFSTNNAKESNTLLVTKPGLRSGGVFHETNVPLVGLMDGLAWADIVILAIPARVLVKFMEDHGDLLKNKVVVDTTNSIHRGEDLLSILALTPIRSVKAFNDIGAVEALLDKPSNKRKIPSKMCSKHPDALQLVRDFAEDSLGLDVKLIPYHHYAEVAQSQNRLDESWIHAIAIMMTLFAITESYAIMRYNYYKGYELFHLPLQVTNKAMCWTALNGFALTQLPGVIARVLNSVSDDNLRSKPQWLRRFLQLRKHLGLVSLWFLMVHILMSMLLFSPAYYAKFFIDPTASKSKLNSIAENSMLFAVLGASLYALLGVCSLPSVGSQMSNLQWNLVYGPVAWTALAFGTVHVLIMGVKGWTEKETWPGNLPPITMTAVLIPLAVMALKVLQMGLARFDISITPYPTDDENSVPVTAHLTKDHITRNAGRPLLENGYHSLCTLQESRHTDGMDTRSSCEPDDIENTMDSHSSCLQDDVALGEDDVDVENPPVNQMRPNNVENESTGNSLRIAV